MNKFEKRVYNLMNYITHELTKDYEEHELSEFDIEDCVYFSKINKTITISGDSISADYIANHIGFLLMDKRIKFIREDSNESIILTYV